MRFSKIAVDKIPDLSHRWRANRKIKCLEMLSKGDKQQQKKNRKTRRKTTGTKTKKEKNPGKTFNKI